MPIDPSRLIDGLKLPTKTIFALCTAAGLLLFLPDNFLKVLGLDSLVNANRAYLGGLFVVALCLLMTSALVAFATLVKPWAVQALWIRLHRGRLKCLTPDEKEILAYYIQNQTRSQALDYKSGTVNALVREKIIVLGSTLGHPGGFYFDHVIQPWAWKYLNENRHLLE